MRGLAPRIHLFSQERWIATEFGLARVPNNSSRVNPTCGVKPGNDGIFDAGAHFSRSRVLLRVIFSENRSPLFGITRYLLAALRFTVTRMIRLVLLW